MCSSTDEPKAAFISFEMNDVGLGVMIIIGLYTSSPACNMPIIFCFFLLLNASALDAENEFLVQEALERLMEGRTVLIIAHRLSTIQSADAVAVLDKRRVVECGRHAQLLANQGGLFRKLMEKQAFLQAEQIEALSK